LKEQARRRLSKNSALPSALGLKVTPVPMFKPPGLAYEATAIENLPKTPTHGQSSRGRFPHGSKNHFREDFPLLAQPRLEDDWRIMFL